MKLLLTGASSFTGTWIAESLAAAGHEIVAPLRGTLAGYAPNRRRRLERLAGKVRLVEAAPFGSETFLALLKAESPFDGLCHHAAEVANYRSPDFNALEATAGNSHRLPAMLAALAERNHRVFVILTGSVFENDEGLGEPPLRAFSPYGLSKGLTWQMFRHYCGAAEIRLGKFVIPNPFGPLEEPRFTAYLVKTWKENKPASVQTPAYIRDNIHVDLLARAYAGFAAQRATDPSPILRCNPSGYVESQGDFALRCAAEFRRRAAWDCAVSLQEQKDFSEPLRRVNFEPVSRLFPDWVEAKAWDAMVEFYR